MKVLKFGGTSMGSAETIRTVKQIVENQTEKVIVVVSAFSGITNHLIAISNKASNNDLDYLNDFMKIETRHLETAKSLVSENNFDNVAKEVHVLLDELSGLLHGVSLVNELTPRTMDCILSFGERLSATIVCHVIKNAKYYNSADLIKTDNSFNKARVDFSETNLLFNKLVDYENYIPILPGFIGSTSDGVITTLGRGGSDYSAAIVASALNASILEIWTDVDGFMTADPSKVVNAYPIENLSYAEAMELSHFGAKVIYTPTIQPAFEKNIPIYIKNTFNPTIEGTLISASKSKFEKKPIKGISSIDKIALLTIQGSGMVGVTGTSMRLFGALAKANVNIILISQASSEFSISMAIIPEDIKIASQAIEKEFYVEMILQKNINYRIEDELSIIAIVGENMIHTPGIAANLFSSLGRNGVNIVAIAQGSSELNISTVIQRKNLIKALNVVHDGFFLSDFIQLNIFLAGIGNVGGKLLSQIINQKNKLFAEHKLKITVAGIAKSNKMLINQNGIELIDNFNEYLLQNGENSNISNFVKKMIELNLQNSVFIDCTATNETPELYADILNSYISVVTANKIACSSEYSKYEKLKNISISQGVKFLYETNVGAGLPVLRTISDLIKSGDKIVQLEAVVSGTLNFIFNTLSSEIPISMAIRMAMEKGYSEPDPRLDLRGTDVLRKLLILSREAGYKLEKSDIKIKNFLPDICFSVATIDEFFKEVEKLDADFETRRKELASRNHKWRYVASLKNENATIELIEVNNVHPLYNLEGGDNIIIIYTERYTQLPMVIKGAGAGAEVTATGLFADLIRVANI